MDQVMDSCASNPLDDHARTIIHLDIDCFYVQVETLKNPELRNQPVGIQQKHIVVTCNYIAREFGVKKCMNVTDVLRLCPKIVLVNGEDLKDYRHASARVTNLLQKFTPIVERLGLDENFVDVSAIVQERLEQHYVNVQGHIYTSNVAKETEPCICGCRKRLTIGSQIALEMREMIFNELDLTTSAGIAYNKLLAKLVGAVHKPNQQTVLFAENVPQLLCNLPNIRNIPGIGLKTAEMLSTLGISTITDVFSHSVDKLSFALGSKEAARKIFELCKGQDRSVVKPYEKPQSIGLEDSCKIVNLEVEVENKLKQLLGRLMQLVIEDGRIPQTVKVVVRKYDDARKSSHREQKQCNIPSSLFKIDNVITLSEQSQNKLMAIIMKLFYKMVDVKKSFRLTLLGLAFTKFLDRINGKNSIASFFMKNVSVQSVIDFQNESNNSCSSQLNSPVPMDCGTSSPRDYSWEVNTESESDVEPSPKKTKFGKLQNCNFNNAMDISPSKLQVANLQINSRENDKNYRSPESEEQSVLFKCPPGVDESVFKALPPDIKKDVINDWALARNSSIPTQNIKRNTKTDSILKYLISNN